MLRFQSAIADALAGGVWSFLRAGMRLKYGLDVGMPRPPLGTGDGVWSDEQVRELLTRVDGPA
jgi:hypothetical protein